MSKISENMKNWKENHPKTVFHFFQIHHEDKDKKVPKVKLQINSINKA